MVYCVRDNTIPGVPLIAPLFVLKWNADPGDGEISHDVTVPPVDDGETCGLMATFLVPVMSLLE